MLIRTRVGDRLIAHLLLAVVLGVLLGMSVACVSSTEDDPVISTPLDDPVVQRALQGPKTGLTLTLVSHASSATPLPDAGPAAGTQCVHMNIEHADGKVLWLSSATVDAATGALTQATVWRVDVDTARFLDARRCEVQSEEPPTAPILLDVLADTIGPLRDPAGDGFTIKSESVVERDEGPVIQRITNFPALDQRTIEYVSTRGGAVHSSIEAIRLTDSFTDLRPYLDGVCPDVDLAEFVSLLTDDYPDEAGGSMMCENWPSSASSCGAVGPAAHP